MLKKSTLVILFFLILTNFVKPDEFKEIKSPYKIENFKKIEDPFKSINTNNEIVERGKIDLKKILLDNNIIYLLIALMGAIIIFFLRSHILRYIIMFFSVIFFGFYIGGCNCAVGASIKIFYELFYKDEKIIISILLLTIPFISTFLFGRIFCGYICPIGALQELISIKDRIIKISPKVESILRKIRLFLFILLIVISIVLHKNLYSYFVPFKAIFNLNGTIIQISLGIIILMLSLFIFRPFCRFLCPLSIFLEKISLISLYKIKKDKISCDKCTFCYKTCKMNAINSDLTFHNDKCIRCSECLICKKCKSNNNEY